MSDTAVIRSPTRNRLLLVGLFTIFLAPFVLAWVLVDHWRPGRLSHHGELLQPARPVAPFVARQPDGRPLPAEFFNHRWTLAVINTPACAERCRKTLYYARQIRLGLGQDLARIQTLFLTGTKPSADFTAWFAQQHAAMTFGVASADTLGFFTAAFPTAAPSDPGLFLLDPMGNLVMRYSADADPKGIIQDLERLLKYSAIR